VDPAALLAGRGEDISQDGPRPERAVAGHELWHVQATVFDVPEDGGPRVGALAVVGVRDCKPEGLLGSVVCRRRRVKRDGVSGCTAGRRERRACEARGGACFPSVLPAGLASVCTVRGTERRSSTCLVGTRTFVGRQHQLELLAQGLSGGGAVAITQVHAIHSMVESVRRSWRRASPVSIATTTM
jgi:hypothetical protein